MTTQLSAVPDVAVVQPDRDRLTDAAIEWADNAAELAKTLASSLRDGDTGIELLRKALAQARANLALSKAIEELLDVE